MQIKIANEEEKQEVFKLRLEVFVNEQNVPPEIELDSEDVHATHVIATEKGQAVGCARLLLEGNSAHIGRLAVKRQYRKKGIGREICEFIINYCNQNGYKHIWLNSQIHAVDFYKKLGFTEKGRTFMEAGIEHIRLEKE